MTLYDFLLALSAAMFTVVAFLYVRHPAASLLHPATIYLGLHGVVFVIRPIFARIFDYQHIYTAYQFHPSIDDKVTVILGANLGFLVFMGVCMAVAGQPYANTRDRFDEMQRNAMIKPVLLTMLLVAPICLWSIVDSWLTKSTGSSTMIIDAATGTPINTTDNGWFASADMALAPLTVIFAWQFRFRLWSLVPFAVFFVLKAGTGGRGAMIVASLALVMLFLFEHRKRWPEWRSALLLVFAAIAFTLIVQDRGRSVRNIFITNTGPVTTGAPAGDQPLESMDFANLEFFEYVVYAVPQRSGTYDYFLSNLQIFTEPIPRKWWSNKPVGPPIKLFNLWDYGHPVGMTVSLPGAGWLELGWIGIIVQCGAFAAGYGWLYRRLMTRRQSNLYVLFYGMMVAATIVTYRDGTLLTVARQMPFYVGPIVLLWGLMRAYRIPSADTLSQAAGATARRAPTRAKLMTMMRCGQSEAV